MTEMKRDLLLGIGVLVAAQILLAFGAIGLLLRIQPVIDRILHENIYSIEAAEEMLLVLALTPEKGGADRELEGRFFGALARARDNVTLSEKPEILNRIEEGFRDSIGGGALPRARLVAGIEELSAINRRAMRQTRDQASRLSEAGAWAAVLMAVLGFAVGVVVLIRVDRRIAEPLDEIDAVLRAYRGGDAYRRCQFRDAPPELRELMGTVNDLLDRRASGGEPREAPSAEAGL